MTSGPREISYILKSGKFKGKSIAQLYLTRYPELENFIDWARDMPNLSEAVESFERLRSRLKGRKLIAKKCDISDCPEPAPYMSLIGDSMGLYSEPDFWCENHKPWEEVGKERISIEASTRFHRKRDQRRFLEQLCKAMGITRITKRVAEDFFHPD